MTTADVRTIYEQHVRRLPQAQQLELLALIADRLTQPEQRAERPARSIRELHGVGRASWDGSDAQEYVNRLREEGDERGW
jgi:hypothetical protein